MSGSRDPVISSLHPPPSRPPPTVFASRSGLLRPIPSSSSYSPIRHAGAALASSLLQPPIHSNPAFSFIKQQYRNWFCWGLCFLSSGLRLPVVLATMPLDDAGFLGCDFDFIPLLALYIVGTLIKLVYTARCGGEVELLFIKFERRSVDECFEFVRAEGLLGYNDYMLLGGVVCIRVVDQTQLIERFIPCVHSFYGLAIVYSR